jgi:hypothetical protein
VDVGHHVAGVGRDERIREDFVLVPLLPALPQTGKREGLPVAELKIVLIPY